MKFNWLCNCFLWSCKGEGSQRKIHAIALSKILFPVLNILYNFQQFISLVNNYSHVPSESIFILNSLSSSMIIFSTKHIKLLYIKDV